MRLKHSIWFLFVVFGSSFAHGQDSVDYRSITRDWEQDLLRVMQRHEIAGMSYALFDSKSIIAAKGLGLADVMHAQSARDSTLYLIGSVTKLFTTTAILQLRDAGLLRLSDPLVKYVPELEQMKTRHRPISDITIEQVLTHHSGLPSDLFKDLFREDTVQAEYLLKQLAGLYTTYPPEFVYSYSNVGFTILGLVIERVSGLSYEDYLQLHISLPLGLHFTTTEPTEHQAHLISRTYDIGGDETAEMHIRDVAAGGIYSNVLDLATFGQAYLTGKILPDSSIEQSFTRQNAHVPLDLDQEIGYTWNISKRPASGRLFHHSGANLYYRAMFILAPDLDIGIALLTNSRTGSALLGSCFQLLDKIGNARGIQFAFEDQAEGWDITEKPKKLKLSEAYLDQYTGVYAMPGAYYRITEKRGKLRTRIDGLNLDFLPIDSQRFIPRYRFLNIFPMRVSEIRMYIDTLSGETVAVQQDATGERSLFGHKIAPYEIPDAWRSRLGHYDFQYPDSAAFQFLVSFDLLEEDGYLLLDVEVPVEGEQLHFIVIPIDSDRAYLAGLGRYGWYVMQSLGRETGAPILELYGYRWIRSY